jgi:hypothetical protein
MKFAGLANLQNEVAGQHLREIERESCIAPHFADLLPKPKSIPPDFPISPALG